MSNHKREERERQMASCRNEWFKDHVATIVSQNEHGGTVINWQNPGSWNYGCRFIIHAGWLIVVGDIGEAVYQWSGKLTLEFLAGIDFGYFYGKCQASEKGKSYDSFDSRIAHANLQEWLTELDAEYPIGTHRYASGKTERDWREAIDSLRELSPDDPRDEYHRAVTELYDVTGDGEEAGMVEAFGIVPDCRAIGHFVGFKMAIAQLLKPAVTPV
ncbi:MAG: hypothetical protein JWM68_3753 [Verrucomicrobiales bacterium]|nr:hypothetical protein [Verrucomicrobiales bacterium]